MKSIVSILALIGATFPAAQAGPSHQQVATITQIEGQAQIFVNPSKKPIPGKSTKDGTMALFENEYYLVQEAKIGDQVQKNTIIRTLPNAQVQIVYDNGDQFHMGPGTAYRVTWNDKSELEAKINLMYGRLRGVISKEGPRQKIEIKTRTVTMGVRGTDFFVADTGPNGETEVSVLRGAVDLFTGKKEVEVKTGESAKVSILNAEPKIDLRETTKEDLGGIQKASTMTTQSKLTPKLEELEKKALQVTTKDIQLYQPELFKQISSNLSGVKSAQDLNTKMMTLVASTAPSAPAKRTKPRITELKDSDEGDVYDKYFKIDK